VLRVRMDEGRYGCFYGGVGRNSRRGARWLRRRALRGSVMKADRVRELDGGDRSDQWAPRASDEEENDETGPPFSRSARVELKAASCRWVQLVRCGRRAMRGGKRWPTRAGAQVETALG
jgi:hypothetical protein